MPHLFEAYANLDYDSEFGVIQKMYEDAKEEAKLAQQEVDEHFPILHAQASIAIWAGLKTAIRLFLVKWLQHCKTAIDADMVQKLRVRIGEYERLEGEDRFFYILDRLEQELSTPLRSGVKRFEAILEPFGLSGPVDKDVQRDIFELKQLRNNLVHCSGIADRRLINACPWLGLTSGDRVKISRAAYVKYFASVMAYATVLMLRVADHFGLDVPEHLRDSKNPESSTV